MKLWQEPISFDWDQGNIDKNLKKHKVTNQEAEEVFSNQPVVILRDEKHSQVEKRHLIIGVTNKKRTLTIIFTIRKNKVRIVSARDAHKKERQNYEKA